MQHIEIDGLLFERMIDDDQIQKRVRLMGIDISMKYEDKHPVFIGVLNGCFMFMADLMRQIHISCEMSFIKIASYDGMESSQVRELIGLGIDLRGRHVIIVEDIVDTGNSLKHTIAGLEKLGVASISICTMLLKPSCLQHDFDNIMYVGFEVDKEFVVGYGLDYNEQCRNLPDIYRKL